MSKLQDDKVEEKGLWGWRGRGVGVLGCEGEADHLRVAGGAECRVQGHCHPNRDTLK